MKNQTIQPKQSYSIKVPSILFLLILYILFYVHTELSLRDAKSNKRIIITVFSSICLVTTFAINNEFSFLFAFIYLLFLLCFSLQAVRFNMFLIDLLFENPYKLLISSFALIVFIGSLLLSMPFSSSSRQGILFIDALFTATSAVCVTGLVVLDTYKDFSMIGQGIITIMTFISILLVQTTGNNRYEKECSIPSIRKNSGLKMEQIFFEYPVKSD